ncbi:MAG TPA: hypothetical protein ENJ95_14935 [Bacteroidetes bacterium]|nr:hypothetical protein [Bacteroidota bacterium]
MKYYSINPDVIIGYCFFEKNTLPNTKECLTNDDTLVVVFEADYGSYKDLLMHSFYTIVSKKLKTSLEESGLSGLSFRVVDKIIREYMVDENGLLPNAITFNDDYWLLIGDEINSKSDFMKWRTSLIVSEPALNLLYELKAFEDDRRGTIFGAEYEVIMNKISIEGPVKDFFPERWLQEHNAIQAKWKAIENKGQS